MIILGIESSCDDSAAAVITSEQDILSNIVLSQFKEHEPYKGVVPEIAARSHLNYVQRAILMALEESKCTLQDIDLIAATTGPGLIGSVMVGTMYAKALSISTKKPYIGVNHLHGHALTTRLTHKLEYPYLLLLASGGHCQFVAVLGCDTYHVLGTTLDDAAGEAFDKVAKMMGLQYPGGPIIERLALEGDEDAYTFPKIMAGRQGCDMSFSGLKTAVRTLCNSIDLTEENIKNVAASFQKSVVSTLADRTQNAMVMYQQLLKNHGINDNKQFVISGGVAANRYIMRKLSSVVAAFDYACYAPELHMCTDNAAMIAQAGYERFLKLGASPLSLCPRARWPICEDHLNVSKHA